EDVSFPAPLRLPFPATPPSPPRAPVTGATRASRPVPPSPPAAPPTPATRLPSGAWATGTGPTPRSPPPRPPRPPAPPPAGPRTGPAVRRDGLAIVPLAEPVAFGHPHNDPVRVVLALAGASSARHLQLVAGIANIFNDSDAVARLAAATTPDEVREILGVA